MVGVNQPVAYRMRFRTPLDDKHAPRGIYMLFLVTNTGAVSHAQWVVLR